MTQLALKPPTSDIDDRLDGISPAALTTMCNAAARFFERHAPGGDAQVVTAAFGGLTVDAPPDAAGRVSKDRSHYRKQGLHIHHMGMLPGLPGDAA
ncbi:hypothetical protein C1I98_37760 [Spongiactinospora gelatinilytica]|uniref:Uncharacterized protein n=1 Tax=Spongiactinospora gelatinilytica TaxID=2666298 RepID=A0A2W2EBN9_9ACTN|nr:hypothetical protein [Spongiactinospora gelatinilytica]PZG19881.1 hypothetical protein C1I98_37760 [Spongiactinospora gelatinilytica]